MSSQVIISLSVVTLAGVALASQGMINAALGRSVDSPLVAAAVSFGVGFVALLAVSLITGHGHSFQRLTETPASLMVGGFLGAFFVWSIAWGVPSLGVVSAFAALILGQMLAALLLDATGAFGLAVHEVTLPRIAAVILVIAGVILSRF